MSRFLCSIPFQFFSRFFSEIFCSLATGSSAQKYAKQNLSRITKSHQEKNRSETFHCSSKFTWDANSLTEQHLYVHSISNSSKHEWKSRFVALATLLLKSDQLSWQFISHLVCKCVEFVWHNSRRMARAYIEPTYHVQEYILLCKSIILNINIYIFKQE